MVNIYIIDKILVLILIVYTICLHISWICPQEKVLEPWVAGNEVVVKNVNARYMCLYRGFFCLSWFSFASLPQLISLLQVHSGLILFLCKSEAALEAKESQERQKKPR